MNKFQIIDSHIHLWDPNILSYPWLEGNSLLNRSYLLEDYLSDFCGINVKKVVFMEAACDQSIYKSRITSSYLKEVQWISNLSASNPLIGAIISRAPVEKGEMVRTELDKLFQNKLVKGVRRVIKYEKDLEFCIKPNFVKGVQLLNDYNFSFDVCASYLQLGNVAKLVEQCPHVKIILDHIGEPDIKNHLFYLAAHGLGHGGSGLTHPDLNLGDKSNQIIRKTIMSGADNVTNLDGKATAIIHTLDHKTMWDKYSE